MLMIGLELVISIFGAWEKGRW